MNLDNLSTSFNKNINNANNSYPNQISKELSNILSGDESKIEQLLKLLDNNYVDEFNKELEKIGGLEVLQQMLNQVPSTVDGWYLYSRVVSLNIFYNLIEKLSENNKEQIFQENIQILEKFFLNLKLQDNILDQNLFSAVNTVLSYFSYNLALNGEISNGLKENIITIFTDLYNRLGENQDLFTKLKDAQKLVFLSNLKLLNTVFDTNFEYSKFFQLIDLYKLKKFDYFSFLVDYAGFDIDLISGHIKGDLENIPNWLGILASKDNIAEKIVYLANYSGFLNVKLVASKYNQIIDLNNLDFRKIDYFSGSLTQYLSSQINRVPLKYLAAYIKTLVIRYFNLKLQTRDILINLVIFPTNFIILPNLFDSEHGNNELASIVKEKNNGLVHIVKEKNNIKIGLKIRRSGSINSNLENLDIYKKQFLSVLDKLINKISNVINFRQSVKLKLDKLSIHTETLTHMKNLGNLLNILYDDFPEDEKNIIKKLCNLFLMEKKDLFSLFAYLHDIGKADNTVYLEQYNNFNGKLFTVDNFNVIVNSIFGFSLSEMDSGIDIDNNISVNQNDNFFQTLRKIKFKYYDQILSVVQQFNDVFSNPAIYFRSINTEFIDNQFLMRVFDIYKLLPENFDIKILSENIDISNLISQLNQYFKTVNYNFNGEINLNKFLFSILLFLDGLTQNYISKLTTPHIEHGIDFFAINPEFNYLSWVLLHHNYPEFGKFIGKKLDKGLIKWAELTENKALSNIIPKLDSNKPFPNEYKDFFMVLLTALDLIDALFSKRSYQVDTEFLKFSGSYFSDEFKVYVKNLFDSEDLSNPDYIWDKVMRILTEEFKGNKNFEKVKQILEANKLKIINTYKKKL